MVLVAAHTWAAIGGVGAAVAAVAAIVTLVYARQTVKVSSALLEEARAEAVQERSDRQRETEHRREALAAERGLERLRHLGQVVSTVVQVAEWQYKTQQNYQGAPMQVRLGQRELAAALTLNARLEGPSLPHCGALVSAPTDSVEYAERALEELLTSIRGLEQDVPPPGG